MFADPRPVLRVENSTGVFLRKGDTFVEQHTEIGGVRRQVALREYQAGGRRLVLVLDGAVMGATVERIAEVFSRLDSAIQLTRRPVVAEGIGLVIRKPERLVLWIEV